VQTKKQMQDVMNKAGKRENVKQITHSYHPKDCVLLNKTGIIPKMSQPHTIPFAVMEVFTKGTA
jgi:hypothetical protein